MTQLRHEHGIFARPLGDVVYLMVTPTTPPAKCSQLLHSLLVSCRMCSCLCALAWLMLVLPVCVQAVLDSKADASSPASSSPAREAPVC